MDRWSPPRLPTERLIALSQLACVATLGALALSHLHGGPLLNGAFLASLAVFALAAAGVAVHTRRLSRIMFAAFAAISVLMLVAELFALVSPDSGVGQVVHTVSAVDKAVLVATLNALLPLYGQAVLAARERATEALEGSVVAERTLTTMLEARVAVRTAELEDAQRVLQRMWRLGQQISRELDQERVLERFVDAVGDIAQADGVAIALLEDDGDLRIAVARGALLGWADAHIPATGTAMGHVIRVGTPWRTDDAQAVPGPSRPGDSSMSAGGGIVFRLAGQDVRSVAALPVSRRGERIGAVTLVRRSVQPFADLTLARVSAMADLLHVALENAELVESLRRTEWRFRTLFRSAPDAVFTVLQSGRIREANDAVSGILGMDALRTVGRRLSELAMGDDQTRLDQALAHTFAGNSTRLEVNFRREPEGSVRLVSLAASLLPEADPPGVLVVARDITSERDMRVRLMESDRLAAVGELVAGVAHEVNNPLSSISAYAQLLLRDDRVEGTLREQVEVIRSETTRASQVVKDLLAFARRSEPRHEPLDLNQVVARTLRMRAFQLSASRVMVRQSLADDLPPVTGDARQLQQVCLNLVTNATQAMAGRGGGTLSIATMARDGQVLLEVGDTGSGIPAEARARIFEPFYTTKKEGEGTGLGLSVSYGIIAAHGGSIEVVDTSPEGTTFRVTLPAGARASVGAGPVADAGLDEGSAMVLRSPIAGTRLLFVDDEPAICAGVTAYAAMRGFAVITASSGEAAVDVLADTSVDAVVCDIRMPGMDGFAFHGWLQRERPGLAERTVFITGDVVTATRRGSGRQPILAKPFTFERLEEAVTAVIQGRPLEPEPDAPPRKREGNP